MGSVRGVDGCGAGGGGGAGGGSASTPAGGGSAVGPPYSLAGLRLPPAP